MIETIKGLIGDISLIEFFSRIGVASAWAVALFQILKARYAPMANQAFVAAFALVLGQVLLIYQAHIPRDALTFFIAMAQIVMAISVVKIFHWASHLTDAEVRRIKATEDAVNRRNGSWRTFGRSLLIISGSGLVYFLLHALEVIHG